VINLTSEQRLTAQTRSVRFFAFLAVGWGFLSAIFILFSGLLSLRDLCLILGLSVYLGATAASILAGKAIKKIDDHEWAEYINKTIQRRSVILLNGSVGTAIVIATLFTDPVRMIAPLAILAGFGVLYAISYYAKLITPHSFAARFRSTVVHGLLGAILVHLVVPQILLPVVGVILGLLYITWRSLRKDQAIYGWPDR